MTEQRKFTRIAGLSDRVMLPRCGKVRLGEKRVNPKGAEYPVDLPYFKFDEEMLRRYPKIASVCGDRETGAIEPKELHIIFPLEDEETVFPQSLRFYGRKRGLRCIGDGLQARCYVCRKCGTFDCACDSPELDAKEMKCKCDLYDQGKCKEQASLMFVLPEITWEGCWQLDTGSYHNIVHLNSAIKFVRGVLGRIALVPLTLRRIPVEITHQGQKRTHYLLSLGFDGDTETVRRLRAEMPVGPAALPPMPRYELPAPVLDGDDIPAVPEPDEPPPPDEEPMPDPEPPPGLAEPSGEELEGPEAFLGDSGASGPAPAPEAAASTKQVKLISSLANDLHISDGQLSIIFPKGVSKLAELSKAQASAIINHLLAQKNSKGNATDDPRRRRNR